jgi:hypothetical protein
MSVHFEKDSTVQNHRIKQRDLIFEVAIVANATPADKKHASDLHGVAFLRTEGKISEADAIEDLSADFTAADDNNAGNSQFGILIDASKLSGEIDKIYKVTVTEQTALATSLTVAPAQATYLTTEGNIAIDITGTGLNLASESPTFLIEVEYLIK